MQGSCCDGLRLWKEREQCTQIRLNALRKPIAAGMEQADQGQLVDGPGSLCPDFDSDREPELSREPRSIEPWSRDPDRARRYLFCFQLMRLPGGNQADPPWLVPEHCIRGLA